MLDRTDWEQQLNQKAKVLWFTGLSGAGKTTLARALEQELFEENKLVKVLDGDILRGGINSNLGFSLEDRMENIRRVAEIAKLFADSGFIVIVAFISPTQAMRDYAKSLIGADIFHEIYVKASLSICENRDVKGLYKKARTGEIPNFTGISSPYEVPSKPNLTVSTEYSAIDKSLAFLYYSIFNHRLVHI
jgi:adenylylsulfate kinase